MSFEAPLPIWVPVSSPFGMRNGRMHEGVDWAAPVGTETYCAEAGFVRYLANEPGGYGNTITVEHADGWESRYAHLSAFHVGSGDTVSRGQVLAVTGGAAGAPGAGSSTGPHLHHELRHYGTPVDPIPLCTYGGQIPGGGDMTDEQLATLGQWMQQQTAIMLDTLVGPGWRGNVNILGAWHNDTRNIVNAHTDVAVGAAPASAAVDAVEESLPTELPETARD